MSSLLPFCLPKPAISELLLQQGLLAPEHEAAVTSVTSVTVPCLAVR